ncbi:MAG: dTDP-4-dehydrorhamnose reductase [Candidatus Xenobiia bacterium LiM19]
MRIALIGKNGQLAHDLIRVFKDEEMILLSHDDIAVENRDHTIGLIQGLRPDLVINTAAFHKVDLCEDERQQTFDVNCAGAVNAAVASARVGASYVFYSTDYVFGAQTDRVNPYREDEPPGPVNVYGWSKLAGEIGVKNICTRYFIIRSTGLYGSKVSGKGHNFPGLMLKLGQERDEVKVVDDQRLTPTCTFDLAQKTAELVKTDHYGLYHMTNAGDCTWYEFTRELFSLRKIKTRLVPVDSAAFPTKAQRPAYSVLDNKHLRDIGITDMRPWKDALQGYLTEIGLL